MRRILIGILMGLGIVGIYFALLEQNKEQAKPKQGRYKLGRKYIKVKPETYK